MPTPLLMTVSRLSSTVSFAANGRDSVSIQGMIPSTSPAGQTVMLSIDGARASFKLDTQGRGKSAQGSFACKSGRFTAKIQNGAWSGTWGLNPKASAAKAKLPISATLWIGGDVYAASITASCTAKANVGAKIKK
jgi:hypothetical protein